jgi:hypothetical protein
MLDRRRCGPNHFLQDLASISKGLDLPVVKYEHLVDLLKNVWAMRDYDHGCATSLEILKRLDQGFFGTVIQIGVWLIKDDQARFPVNGSCKSYPLSLTAG